MAVMWCSNHLAIYRSLRLRLAIAIRVTRIDRKVIIMQLGYQFNSYNLMHIQESQLSYRWVK
jgi:hypothetical protein